MKSKQFVLTGASVSLALSMAAKKPGRAFDIDRALVIVAAIAIAFLVLCGLARAFRTKRPVAPKRDYWVKTDDKHISNAGGCSMPGTRASGKGSCADNPNMAPVLEASFNGVQIIKQSLLLEDHLNKEETRCTN